MMRYHEVKETHYDLEIGTYTVWKSKDREVSFPERSVIAYIPTSFCAKGIRSFLQLYAPS